MTLVCEARFYYGNFRERSFLALNGPWPGTDGCLSLTTKSESNKVANSVFYLRRITLSRSKSSGFFTSFNLKVLREEVHYDDPDAIDNGPDRRGDGLAFVVSQLPRANMHGRAGSGLGYDGLPMGFAVEIDLKRDTDMNDPSESHIAVNASPETGGPISARHAANGMQDSMQASIDLRTHLVAYADMVNEQNRLNAAGDSTALRAMTVEGDRLPHDHTEFGPQFQKLSNAARSRTVEKAAAISAVNQILIDYHEGYVTVFVNNPTAPILSVPIPRLEGEFLVGFTSSTFLNSIDHYRICDWYFDRSPLPSPPVAAALARIHKGNPMFAELQARVAAEAALSTIRTTQGGSRKQKGQGESGSIAGIGKMMSASEPCDQGFYGPECIIDTSRAAKECIMLTSEGCAACTLHVHDCRWCASTQRCVPGSLVGTVATSALISASRLKRLRSQHQAEEEAERARADALARRDHQEATKYLDDHDKHVLFSRNFFAGNSFLQLGEDLESQSDAALSSSVWDKAKTPSELVFLELSIAASAMARGQSRATAENMARHMMESALSVREELSVDERAALDAAMGVYADFARYPATTSVHRSIRGMRSGGHPGSFGAEKIEDMKNALTSVCPDDFSLVANPGECPVESNLTLNKVWSVLMTWLIISILIVLVLKAYLTSRHIEVSDRILSIVFYIYACLAGGLTSTIVARVVNYVLVEISLDRIHALMFGTFFLILGLYLAYCTVIVSQTPSELLTPAAAQAEAEIAELASKNPIVRAQLMSKLSKAHALGAVNSAIDTSTLAAAAVSQSQQGDGTLKSSISRFREIQSGAGNDVSNLTSSSAGQRSAVCNVSVHFVLLLSFSIVLISGSVLCFLAEREWLIALPPLRRVPIYTIIAAALVFTVVFLGIEMSYIIQNIMRYVQGLSKKLARNTPLSHSVWEMRLLSIAALASGAFFGITFGFLDVQDASRTHIGLALQRENWYCYPVSLITGACTALVAEYLRQQRLGGRLQSHRRQSMQQQVTKLRTKFTSVDEARRSHYKSSAASVESSTTKPALSGSMSAGQNTKRSAADAYQVPEAYLAENQEQDGSEGSAKPESPLGSVRSTIAAISTPIASVAAAVVATALSNSNRFDDGLHAGASNGRESATATSSGSLDVVYADDESSGTESEVVHETAEGSLNKPELPDDGL